jgi:hypothetical protein
MSSVTFDDGTQGVVDVAQLVKFTGVFEPLGRYTKLVPNEQVV